MSTIFYNFSGAVGAQSMVEDQARQRSSRREEECPTLGILTFNSFCLEEYACLLSLQRIDANGKVVGGGDPNMNPGLASILSAAKKGT
jgi:hypothetical protein